MGEIAPLRDMVDEQDPRVQFLVADDDALARSELASCVRDVVGEIAVLEAEDGAQAIQLGLQRRPDIALLDITMPRLGGIEAAVTLRELRPSMRLGLRTDDTSTHRERAREHDLPLFSKLELDRTLAWLEAQVHWSVGTRSEPDVANKRSFVCGRCGYGALREDAPDRCPMCRAESAWVETPWRPSGMLVTG